MGEWNQDMKEAAERIPPVREAAKEAAGRLEDKTARATAKVAQGLRDAEGQVRDLGSRASETWNKAYDEMSTVAQRNPGTMTLVAFGAGLGTGLWMAHRRSMKWRSAVPAVTAVADAVLDLIDRRR
jgi:hypothetical protein